jgi:flagellar protein FliJ
MKKFKFRLERVLEYRERIRMDRRNELMQARHMLSEAVRKLQELEAEALANADGDGTRPVHEFVLRADYRRRLRTEMALQRERIIEAERVVDAAQARYVEASRDARALDMLKEKKRAEYSEQLMLHEINVLDEMTTQRSRRGSKE